jgi:hypothetical protein
MLGFMKKLIGRLSTRSAKGKLWPECQIVVTFDDESVTCQRPKGKTESVRWKDLAAVIIETNDTGPFGTDVYWLLLGRDGASGCVIPNGATGEKELVNRLQQLPGFDDNSVIAAMGSVTNQSFLCWKAGDGAE